AQLPAVPQLPLEPFVKSCTCSVVAQADLPALAIPNAAMAANINVRRAMPIEVLRVTFDFLLLPFCMVNLLKI
ncbi:MAG TPA: hypothetical protein VKJ65_02035, partial [Phycisphaerae bacterium]|nr:hypothetical protein [Phycisphaerae bacterium]